MVNFQFALGRTRGLAERSRGASVRASVAGTRRGGGARAVRSSFGARLAQNCVREPALAQALELVNSSEIQRKLSHQEGYIARLTRNTTSHEANTDDIFLRIFARRPSSAEKETAVEFLKSETDRGEAYRSLVWSLLATNEFLFNH